MALYTSQCQSPISSFQFHKKIAVTPPKPLILTIPISQNVQISLQSKHNLQIPNCFISSNDEVSPSNIVLVKGLPLSILEERLKTAFAQFGEVRRVNILKDKKTRKPFGSAYVWFACSEDAESAAKEMNGKIHFCENHNSRILQKPSEGDTIQILTQRKKPYDTETMTVSNCTQHNQMQKFNFVLKH